MQAVNDRSRDIDNINDSSSRIFFATVSFLHGVSIHPGSLPPSPFLRIGLVWLLPGGDVQHVLLLIGDSRGQTNRQRRVGKLVLVLLLKADHPSVVCLTE